MAQYNAVQYNVAQYNSSLLELFLAEFHAATDALVKTVSPMLSDTAFMSADVTKQISSKVLAELVRLNTWLSVQRKPPVSPWEG